MSVHSLRHTRAWVDPTVALDRAIEEESFDVSALRDQVHALAWELIEDEDTAERRDRVIEVLCDLERAERRLSRFQAVRADEPRGDRDLPGYDRRVFGADDGPAVAG